MAIAEMSLASGDECQLYQDAEQGILQERGCWSASHVLVFAFCSYPGPKGGAHRA